VSGTVLLRSAPRLDAAQAAAAAPRLRIVEVEDLTPEACDRRGVDRDTVEAALGVSPEDDLSFLPRLRWAHSSAAGVDDLLGSGTLPDDVTLTSAAGNGAIPLAEHALMLMLMLSRDAPRWLEAQRSHEWVRSVHGELTGARLGLVGYGNSGQDLAHKARACHMDVQALRRKPTGHRDGGVRLLYGQDGLRELMATSDFVVVTAPLTPETRGLLDAEMIGLMKPTAFLIVVSRGGIVDEAALIEALQAGRLAGAGLDALAQEPLPADSPLWDLPRVVITPHNGATTRMTAERGRQILLDNLTRWAEGRPLANVVERARGY
jgi:phosphoglycerate dehydrogenase-like enzyme